MVLFPFLIKLFGYILISNQTKDSPILHCDSWNDPFCAVRRPLGHKIHVSWVPRVLIYPILQSTHIPVTKSYSFPSAQYSIQEKFVTFKNIKKINFIMNEIVMVMFHFSHNSKH